MAQDKSMATYFSRGLKGLESWRSRPIALYLGVLLLIGVASSLAVFAFMHVAVPNTLTITSGPDGSSFNRNAEKYKKILARDGVTLKILLSDGSTENLKRLTSPLSAVDVGFVLGGEV
jgi:TRAP-type uncharacterized transport system substrate-binding protein